MREAVASLLLAALLVSAAPAAYAQSCSMCRATAAAANEAQQRTMDLAILVLLIPTVSIFLGVLVWAYWRRDRTLAQPPQSTRQPAIPSPPDFDAAAVWRALHQ